VVPDMSPTVVAATAVIHDAHAILNSAFDLPRDGQHRLIPLLRLNHPEFHAPSGFCEPAGWSVTCLE
jgi:hypothetical protein